MDTKDDSTGTQAEFPPYRFDLLTHPIPMEALSVRAANALQNAGITTIGELLDLVHSGRKIRGAGETVLAEIKVLLEQTAQQAGVPHFWETPASGDAPDALPAPVGETIPSDEEMALTEGGKPLLPALLPLVMRIVCAAGESEESMRFTILTRRLGGSSGNGRVYTLDEVGLRFGITKERVRQLEVDGRKRLRSFVTEGIARRVKEKLHPHVRSEVRLVIEMLHRQSALLPDAELRRLLSERYGQSITDEQMGYVRILLESLGLEWTDFGEAYSPVWIIDPAALPDAAAIAQEATALFRARVTPLSFDDLVIEINRRRRPRRLSPDLIRLVVGLCDWVEVVDENRYQTRFERLPNYALRAHRVLWEHGTPMTLREITNEINHRQVRAGERHDAKEVSIGNQLAGYEPIVTEGKSRWNLREWGGEDRTILQIMEEFLYRENRPASAQEITDYVQSRRHAKRNSVTVYLSTDPRFQRVGRDTYGLSVWRHHEPYQARARRLLPQEVFDTAAREVFTVRGVSEMPFAELLREVREQLSCGEITARNHLQSSPLLRIEQEAPGLRARAILRDEPGTPAPRRQRKTQMDTAREAVCRLLRAAAPPHRMDGSELVKRVMRETGLPRPTIYTALRKAPDIERLEIGERVYYGLRSNEMAAEAESR